MGYQVIEKNGVRVINPFVLQTSDYRRNIDMFSYAYRVDSTAVADLTQVPEARKAIINYNLTSAARSVVALALMGNTSATLKNSASFFNHHAALQDFHLIGRNAKNEVGIL